MSAGPRHPADRAEAAARILIVDDEVFIRDALQLYFETLGFRVEAAPDGQSAIRIFSGPGSPIDVVILDLVMPGMHGIDLLKVLKDKDPGVEVIITTGCGSMASAIEALRLGAFDYIPKPIVNFDSDILPVVREAIECRRDRLKGLAPRDVREEGRRERSAILERLVELAEAGNRFRREDPILEKITDLLLRSFDVRAAIVMRRGRRGTFTPIHAWGFSVPVPARPDGLPDSELLDAIRSGDLAFFPGNAVPPSWLGVRPEEVNAFPVLACLPLAIGGILWGSLLAYFASDRARNLSLPGDHHPFQVLVPILSSVFSGALKSDPD